jgi:hypothetical protein
MAFVMEAHTSFVHQYLSSESTLKHQLPSVHHSSRGMALGFSLPITIHYHSNASTVNKTESDSQSTTVLEFLLQVVFVVD